MPFALPRRRALISGATAAVLAAAAVLALAAASSERAEAVPATGPFSIGNRVWLDNGSAGPGSFNAAQRNNGLQDSGEVGLNGIRVDLYRDANADSIAQASELVTYDVTAAGGAGSDRPGPDLNGYYLFDSLPAGTYLVRIPASQFAVGTPLAGHHSSTFNGTETVGAAGADGTPASDLDDNGIEPASRRPDLNGVTSGPIVLDAGANDAALGTEPTGERDLSQQPDPGYPINDPTFNGGELGGSGPAGWDGPGSIGRDPAITDETSNVAVDFGFIPPMSIGSRVWLDDSNDPTQWGLGGSRNNGLIDGTDDANLIAPGVQGPGIANVDVLLYYDENNNGIIDGADFSNTAQATDTNGRFLFDGLAPGNYILRFPSGDFSAGKPLNGLLSSFDAVAQVAPTNTTDENDNGIDNASPITNGISSQQVQLVYLSESTTESDDLPTGLAPDADSDLTIDFGFVRPPMSIGNQVWLDDHPTNQSLRGNGLHDTGETAIAGVEVALYRDLDADGVADVGEDTGLRDTTGTDGFYLFGNVPPGDYIVVVVEANFNAGGPLENLISSRSVAPNPIAADNGIDNNDNGIDTSVAGVGVISSRINLAYNFEPAGETVVNEPADGVGGRGGYGTSTTSSDLTVDFGFHAPMSLGNRVWIDDSGSASAWPTSRNNGLREPGDDLDNPNIAGVQAQGVAGVTLRLYRDLDADGVIDAGEDTGRTTTTNATGYYLFDGITRGNYIVGVEASNFTAGARLHGFTSSFGAVAPSDDSTDNTDDGVGSAVDAAFGVASPRIALSYTAATTGAEPTAEADPTPQLQSNRGLNGELDSFSNLTVDFGFSRPAMSIGNRVWLDDHPTNAALRGNGVLDAGEPAVSGVEVALYRDLDTDGNVDAGEDTGFRDVTDASGFYLFSNLPPGSYLVAITAPNFTAGGPLEGLVSSTAPVPADNQTDNNDNGTDTFVAGVGILSSRIQLAAGTEPLAEAASTSLGYGPAGRGNHGELDADSDLTVDFGFARPFVSVGDFVWEDANGDGVQSAGEPGIAGVRVAISDPDDNPVTDVRGNPVSTATTDADGEYLFTDLPPITTGHYTVTVDASSAALTGYWPTLTGAGTPSTDSSNSTATSSTLSVNGAVDLSLDFGFIPTVAVGDFIWVDENRDGVQTAGEPGLPGVRLAISDSNGDPIDDVRGTPVAPVTTDGNGFYEFIDLAPLTAGEGYTVTVDATSTALDGHVPTLTGAGTLTTDSSNGSATSTTLTVNGSSDTSLDFGFIPTVAVGDFVWVDTNGDGVQSAGEPGIHGVQLAITDSNGDPVDDVLGAPVAAATTDADGEYAFRDLPLLAAGQSYTVTIDATSTALDGYWPTATGAGTATTDSSTATAETSTLSDAGDSDTSLDFGFVPTVAVGDFAWLDDDRDGVQDTAEDGIAGVTVTLLTSTGLPADHIDGTPVAAETTDADGHYVFTDLAAGDYTVRFGAVTDRLLSPIGAGTSATDSDPSTTTGTTPVFTVARTATGDTRAAAAGDDAGDALLINPTVDAGYVARSFDLGITKTFASANTTTRVAAWNFTVANSGTDASTDPIVVSDQLPSALTFVSGSGDGFTCAAVAQAVTCTRASGLASGSSASFSLVTSYSVATANISNTATVAGGAGDGAAGNDSSTAIAPSSALRAPVVTPPPTTTPAPGRPNGTKPTPAPTATAEPTSTATPTPTPTPTPTTEPSTTPEPTDDGDSGEDDIAPGFDWGLAAIIAGALLLAIAILGGVMIYRRRLG